MSEKGLLKSISWETRNLGRQSFAIDEDQLANLTDGLLGASLEIEEKQYGKIFVQVRAGKKNYTVLPRIQRQGFYFVETALVPYTILKKNLALETFIKDKSKFVPSRFDLNDLVLSILDREDTHRTTVVKDIAAESFTDDRFHLDPFCPEEVANRRFSFWVDDLLADTGVVFHLLMLGEVCIGFMARKQDNLILAGFARKYVGSGLGDFLWLSVLQDLQLLGFTQSNTMISANNTPVLNLYVRLGFKFKDPAVTLHYWSD